jgi:uncharacterized protein DUF4386
MSPKLLARIAGVFYVMDCAFGPGMYALRKFVVLSDPATTAANVLAHSALFQVGYVGNLIAVATYIGVTALFYLLFKPVNRSVSLLAAFLSLTGCIVTAAGTVFYILPVALLRGAHVSSALTMAQVQALALISFRVYGQFFNLSLVFFEFFGLLLGYLILKSTFLPRILGAGMILSALSWMTYLSLAALHSVHPWILIGGIGELVMAGWMLVAGVNSERWNEQATAAASRLL